MQNAYEIKRRIKTIKETEQITKAMYLISSSKLNKALGRYKSNLLYFNKIRQTLKDILMHSSDISHPFCQHREGERTAYIVIAADKGLCGSYNHNVLEAAINHMKDRKEKYIFVVGQVAREFFNRKGYDIDVEFLYASQNPTFYNAREIGEDIINLYKNNMMDEVYVVYTRIESNMSQQPRVMKLLPIELDSFKDIELEYSYSGDILYHPSPKAVFDLLIPKYVIGLIYGALVQSFASEQQARMMAMDTANKNADDMIAKLNLEYNRVRQESITNELSEIMGGVAALNKG